MKPNFDGSDEAKAKKKKLFTRCYRTILHINCFKQTSQKKITLCTFYFGCLFLFVFVWCGGACDSWSLFYTLHTLFSLSLSFFVFVFFFFSIFHFCISFHSLHSVDPIEFIYCDLIRVSVGDNTVCVFIISTSQMFHWISCTHHVKSKCSRIKCTVISCLCNLLWPLLCWAVSKSEMVNAIK